VRGRRHGRGGALRDLLNPPVVVIGAGAAGLLAALTAARRGVEVVLVESTPDGGRKILISGGGRCNILPHVAQPERYVTGSSPNTLKKILRSWPVAEQRSFFETLLQMPLVLEHETGKLFPESNSARDVRDALMDAVQKAGARVWLGARVTDVVPEEDAWMVRIAGAPEVRARAVVIATGGLSVPKTGSDGAGLRFAETLGHVLTPTYPALTPLLASPHPHAELAGIATDVGIASRGLKPAYRGKGALLVTHEGWSGPAVLDASHVATTSTPESRHELIVDWTGTDPEALDAALQVSGGTVRSSLPAALPRRLLDALVREADANPTTPIAQLKRERRRAVVEALTAYRLPWTGHAGYQKAEVTGGGVRLDEIDPRTMESRRTPGIYFCGEVLDAFGPIGGHNFLWAWATGRAAGMSV
jgi:predicted Rossmann fold flavoprotein